MGCDIAKALGIDCRNCLGETNICPDMGINVGQAEATARQNDGRYAFSLSPAGQSDAQATEQGFFNKIKKTLKIAPEIRARQARAIFLAEQDEIAQVKT